MGRRKSEAVLACEKRRKARRRRRRRAAFLIVEAIVLVALSAVAYVTFKYGKLKQTVLDEEELEIYQDTGDFTNIALFGLDSREGELEEGVRSDCMIIASIDNSTYEVKILSVYRDTLFQQEDGEYGKANSAYNMGGPAEAVALLNRNLDLDIQKYVSVNFSALADVVDAFGGIDIEMTEEEVEWTNRYCAETAQVVGRETTELENAGLKHLDGIQAVAYTRIRYTEGNDFRRTERQRIVLEKIVEKAQDASLATLNSTLDLVLPQVSTNLTMGNFMGMAANAMNYRLTEMRGFPFEVATVDSVRNYSGSYVVPVGLSENVMQLHQYLFAEEGYVPSDTVQEINDDIIYLSGVDPDFYEDGVDVSYQTTVGDTAGELHIDTE